MNLWESVLSSLRSLYANKLRSILTILGIVIGVSAVVFLVSFGRGNQANITAVFESMGSNAIYITSVTSANPSGAFRPITIEDAEALYDSPQAPSIDIVAPMSTRTMIVVYGNYKLITSVSGVTVEIAEIAKYPIDKGTFITEQDNRKRTAVAVLGYKAAINLFGTANPVGEYIRIAGRKFEVIGTVQEKGSMMGTADDYIMIPLMTMRTYFMPFTTPMGRPVHTIVVQATSTDEIDAAKEQITSILQQRHHIRDGQDNDFSVSDLREIIRRMQEVLGYFQVFLGSVGSISLVVGGIGIMNIMLVSVTERTREIGIRMAVGARRRDILRQFLVEAAVLSLAGGLIGLIIATTGAILVSGMNFGGQPVRPIMSPDIVFIALSVAIFIGLVSGSYPAYRAARLDPIESLRHE